MRDYFTDHLANERTHLAYVRTAIALFTFGITLNQFSTFIVTHQPVPGISPHPFVAGWRVGIGMVVFGIVLTLWSAFRFDRVSKDIDLGTYRPNRAAMWTLSLGVLALGAAATIWLLWR